jgi:hypothetical protein
MYSTAMYKYQIIKKCNYPYGHLSFFTFHFSIPIEAVLKWQKNFGLKIGRKTGRTKIKKNLVQLQFLWVLISMQYKILYLKHDFFKSLTFFCLFRWTTRRSKRWNMAVFVRNPTGKSYSYKKKKNSANVISVPVLQYSF